MFAYILGNRRYSAMKHNNETDEFVNFNIERHIWTQMKKIRHAYLNFDGWHAVVDDGDPFDQCTDHDIFVLRTKSRYLAVVLSCFLKHYLTASSIEHIFKMGLDKVNEFDEMIDDDDDIKLEKTKTLSIRNAHTIMGWF